MRGAAGGGWTGLKSGVGADVELKGTWIDDTFAEAFGMKFTRVIVTAHDEFWLQAALQELTGYGSSVIGCDAEVGVERRLGEGETPDGRTGAAVLLFAFSTEALGKALVNRIGQSVMTCATTAVYDGLPEAESRLPLGRSLRFFGDGYQKSKRLGGRRYWRIPVMDGEFVVEESVGVGRGVAGGNFVIEAAELNEALAAARRAVDTLAPMPELITPFPAGIARSGSKVGSRYAGLIASTADAFCPTLRGRVESRLHPDAHVALEVVIDGTTESVVAEGMRRAIEAAAGEGVVAISAGNYGGKLGKHPIHLRPLLAKGEPGGRA